MLYLNLVRYVARALKYDRECVELLLGIVLYLWSMLCLFQPLFKNQLSQHPGLGVRCFGEFI